MTKEHITEEQAIDVLQASGWMKQHDLEMSLMGMRMCLDFMIKNRSDRRWEHMGGGIFICPSCMKITTRHYEWNYCPVCGEDMRGGGHSNETKDGNYLAEDGL